MDVSLFTMIHYFNSLPPMLFWGVQLLFCYAAVLVMLRLFGAPGLYVFIGIAVIAANIQLLKLVKFALFPSPVALGTILFSASYLAVDILTEYYGVQVARRGILLGFAAMLLMLGTMLLTLSYQPLSTSVAVQYGVPNALKIQGHLAAIFLPLPHLLIAGLSSYLISQFADVWLFSRIRKVTGQRWLWLRNNLSTLVAALLDNIVFSFLAWRLLASQPVPYHTLIYTYILGTYLLRAVVAILDTPFIYLAKRMLPKHEFVTA